LLETFSHFAAAAATTIGISEAAAAASRVAGVISPGAGHYVRRKLVFSL